MLLPIISAIAGIFTFPPYGHWMLSFVFLVPLFWFLLKENKLWRLILGVFLFRLIFSTALAYFAFDPFISASSATIFLGMPLSLYFFKKILPENSRKGAIIAVSLPVLWTFWDFITAQYSLLPSFILMAGNALGSSPFLGLSGYGGVIGLTFFATLINSSLAYLIYSAPGKSFKTTSLLTAGIAILFIISQQISLAKLKDNAENYGSLDNSLKIALVSVNGEFFSGQGFFKNQNALEDAIKAIKPVKKTIIQNNADIAIFPEKMIDEEWDDEDKEARDKFFISNQGTLIRFYRETARELGVNLAATLVTKQNSKRYLTIILFNSDGSIKDTYNKSRLAIASENWPFDDWRPFYFNWIKKLAPNISEKSAVFNREYQYGSGERKNLEIDGVAFGPLVCLEVHYPYELKTLKDAGAKFVLHTTSNLWIRYGLKNYLALTDNLRKVESVWFNMPILINGREEKAGIITPDGKIDVTDYESAGKNFGVYFGEVRF